ncbi:hypothetical protein M3Y99_01081300 [Aphelenchoides fujianensis]|nr:hypothetical protein M3Y99_01081300 [Aphelenchoides fujianensis]
MWFCDKRVKRPPTNFDGRMGRLKELHCTNTNGRGNKTIVVFGNSFARCYMPGILEYFKDVYSNVTLLHKNGESTRIT